jgi:hypothetical protein
MTTTPSERNPYRTCCCGRRMVPAHRFWSGSTQVVAVCPVIAQRHGVTSDGKLGFPIWVDLTEHQVWVQSQPDHPRSCCYVDEAEGGTDYWWPWPVGVSRPRWR